MNCWGDFGAVAPRNAGRCGLRRSENARLDRLSDLLLHARCDDLGQKTIQGLKRRNRFKTEQGPAMQLITVKIEKPDDTNFILGQTHFIKSVEDIHEALVAAVPGIKFGLAFCEASGKCLVRWSGTDPAMTDLAKKNAESISAGHSFVVFLGDGFFPLNVLNTLKMVPEVCRIFCATANPTEVVLAETEQGRGILGVVDGFSPKGIESDGDIQWRKDFLRQIGYKL